MRARLFIFLFLILLVVAICSTMLDNYFVNRERLQSVDRELQAVSTVLLHSDFSRLAELESEDAEALISKRLGENRIGKFFVIRDGGGRKVFESAGMRLLPIADVPTAPEWITVRKKGKFIRVFTASFPPPAAGTIQVGFVSNENLILNPTLSARDLFEVLGLTLVGMGLAWALARKLLKPLHRLSEKVSGLASLSDSASTLPPIQIGALRTAEGEGNTRDEFYLLVAGLNRLITRVNRGYEVSRVGSYQMAHELKTPLAILSSEIEALSTRSGVPPETSRALSREIRAISETISAFLLWAEVEGGTARKDLHVVSLATVVGNLAERLRGRFGDRLEVAVEADAKLAVGLVYLEIVLTNLLSNALLYSPADESVRVRVRGPRVEILDRGPGIPEAVRGRLGEPFNRGGDARKGHGLGLATVASITRVFGWKFAFARTDGSTLATLGLDSSTFDE